MLLQNRHVIFHQNIKIEEKAAISMQFCDTRYLFNTYCTYEILRVSFKLSYCIFSSSIYLNLAIISQYLASLVHVYFTTIPIVSALSYLKPNFAPYSPVIYKE